MYNYYERTYYTLDDIRKEVGLYLNSAGPYTMYASYSNLTTFMNKCLEEAGFDTLPVTTEAAESENVSVNIYGLDFIKKRLYTQI